MKVQIARKSSRKPAYECVVIKQANALNGRKEWSSFTDYIKTKRKAKKSFVKSFPNGKKHLILVNIQRAKGSSESAYLESLRRLGERCVRIWNVDQAEAAWLSNLDQGLTKAESLALLEGMILTNYQFLKYKSDPKANSLKKIELEGFDLSSKETNELTTTLEGTCIARDLVNEPVITLTAKKLGSEVSRLSKVAGYKATVMGKAQIEKMGMGGLLGVNRGSIDPPVFCVLEWKPKNAVNTKPVILVGKGVVYDTGGYNLKPGAYMTTMKSDMGGAAAVVGTMYAVSKNKLPLHVVGLIPSTDNRIGGNALVADDIITTMDGTKVEVLNTDAEGRLILADALAYAKKYDPELVIDLATLTGAAAAIVGSLGSAMMGTADDREKKKLIKSGDNVFERVAEMPYWDEYGDMIKSKIADIKNLGGPVGGAMTAGKFLEHFTDYPWIHLDIAGPAYLKKPENYKAEGGTGVGVRLLYDFLKNR